MRLFKRDYNSSYFNTLTEWNPLENFYNNQKIALIRSSKPTGKLLEIGCGRGKLLKELKKFYSISGTDISPFAISGASKFIDKKYLKVSDIEKENIEGKYDLILAFDVLEHIKDPLKTIYKIKNALKKDGFFLFTVPNNYGFFGKLATTYFNFIDKTHISTYPREKWIRLMHQAGFGLDVLNQSPWSIIKSDFGKHLSFNLLIVARKKL